MSSNPDEFEVVIVGAGIAGLTAAFELRQNKPDCKLVVVEAKDQIGGRLFPVSLKGSNGIDIFDLGGQWVSRKQKSIMSLIKVFELETYDQYYEGSQLAEINSGEVTSHKSEFSSMGFLSSLDLYLTVKKIEGMCKEVPLEEPEKCRHAEEWDGMTLESFKQQMFWMSSTYFLVKKASVRWATLTRFLRQQISSR